MQVDCATLGKAAGVGEWDSDGSASRSLSAAQVSNDGHGKAKLNTGLIGCLERTSSCS